MSVDLFVKKKDSFYSLFAIGIFVLLLNIYFFQYLQKIIVKENYKKFETDSKNIVKRVRERLNNYELILSGARGLFAASQSVERDEWRNFVNSLNMEKNFPGTQAVAFSLFVPKDKLAAHIEQIRQEGFSSYNVWPQGDRDEYMPIIYIEPFEGKNLRAFGFDMMSQDVRAKAIKMSRDTNATVLSGKIRLVQEVDVNIQNGFLMYLPVYLNDLPHETIDERRKNLLGLVYIPFRMKDFIWNTLRNDLSDLRIEIFDGDDAVADNLLFDNKEELNPSEINQYKFKYDENISFFQHSWRFRISAVSKTEIGVGMVHFIVFYFGGVIISILLFGMFWLLINNRKEAVKLAEQITSDLKKSEATFRAMNEASPLGIFMADVQGKYVYTNIVYQNICGLSSEETMGDGWINSIYPDDRYQVMQQWNSFISGKTSKYVNAHRFLRKNGTVAWTKVQSVQVYLENKISGYLGVLEDVTDIKLQEGALKESEERARLIIDSAMDAIVIIDEKSCIVGWNKQAEQIFGYRKDEVVGFKLEEKVSFARHQVISKEGFKHFLDKRQDMDFHRRFNIDVIHRDGHLMVVEMSISSIFIEGKEHFSVFIRDITEIRQNEEMIRQRTETMERMNKLMIDRELKMMELKNEIKKYKSGSQDDFSV